MPVESVRPDQIVIMVAFLLLLVALLVMVRRFRGRIATGMRSNKRMHYVEDLALGPQQRLHLIEVDGRCFLVHAGKGHAASFMAVDSGDDVRVADGSMPPAKSASRVKARRSAKPKVPAKSGEPQSEDSSLIGAAIADARKRNPLLRFGQ